MWHYLAEKLLMPDYSAIKVALIGCGGTGSHLLSGLTKLHKVLIETGHPGFHLTVYDPDEVSEANIGRQQFFSSDIGFNKATVLVTRVNLSCGLFWDAVPDLFDSDSGYDLVITAVDTAAARLQIHKSLSRQAPYHRNTYWLDCGNKKSSAQIILGTVGKFPQPQSGKGMEFLEKLPCVTDLYDLTQVKEEDQGPSCSLAEALEQQDLMINQIIADFAIHLLRTGIRQGYLTIHGYFINLESEFPVKALQIEREIWKRMGYKVRKPRVLRVI